VLALWKLGDGIRDGNGWVFRWNCWPMAECLAVTFEGDKGAGKDYGTY